MKGWVKYFTYLVLINFLLLVIILDANLFFYVALLIVLLGLYEITAVTVKKGRYIPGGITLLVFVLLA